MEEFITVFLGGVLSAVLFKLSSSVDDCIWLPPLIVNENKKNKLILGTVYLLTLLLIVIAASCINWSGVAIFGLVGLNEVVFSLVVSIFLICFAGWHLIKGDGPEAENESNTLWEKIKVTFSMTVIGSMDELASFTTALSSGKYSFGVLLIGTLVAGVIILLSFEALKKVPLFKKMMKVDFWWVILALGILFFVSAINDLYTAA